MNGVTGESIKPILKKRYPGEGIKPSKERKKRFNKIKRTIKEQRKALIK